MRKLCFVVLIVLLGGLILGRPGADDFAQWYVERNENVISMFLSADSMEGFVEENTSVDRHLFYNRFSIGQERYYGFAGHFIGESTVSSVQGTFQQLLEKAESVVN